MLSYCRAEVCLLAMWAKRGRINETLSDSDEVTHMFYLVISPSLLLSSLVFFCFPTGHLSVSLPSFFASALAPTPHTSGVATVTANRCLMPLLQRRNAGQEVECMHANSYTSCAVTAAPCTVRVPLCYMQSASSEFFTQTRIHMHT